MPFANLQYNTESSVSMMREIKPRDNEHNNIVSDLNITSNPSMISAEFKEG
jgi:hypothetical protein